MAIYDPSVQMHRANKVVRHDVNLATARAVIGTATLIDTNGQAVTVLVDNGVYSLTFVFTDDTPEQPSRLTILSTELATGDILDFAFESLYVLNAAQAGVTLTLLVDKRV